MSFTFLFSTTHTHTFLFSTTHILILPHTYILVLHYMLGSIYSHKHKYALTHTLLCVIQSLNTSTDRSTEGNRLVSLDVFRGITVALMILVDQVGSAFPEIHHCPWDGIRLADFVMPFFDFMVGVSLTLAYKRFDLESTNSKKIDALKKATVRFLKLFFIGLLTQVLP